MGFFQHALTIFSMDGNEWSTLVRLINQQWVRVNCRWLHPPPTGPLICGGLRGHLSSVPPKIFKALPVPGIVCSCVRMLPPQAGLLNLRFAPSEGAMKYKGMSLLREEKAMPERFPWHPGERMSREEWSEVSWAAYAWVSLWESAFGMEVGWPLPQPELPLHLPNATPDADLSSFKPPLKTCDPKSLKQPPWWGWAGVGLVSAWVGRGCPIHCIPLWVP